MKLLYLTQHMSFRMGGGSKYLNYQYDVEVNGDTINSYLPFYGVAYHVDYGSTKSAFDFEKPVENYNFEKEKNGYRVDLEAQNGMDHVNFTFHISELGFTTLACYQHQPAVHFLLWNN